MIHSPQRVRRRARPVKNQLRSNRRQLIRRVQLVGIVSPGDACHLGLREGDAVDTLLCCRSRGGSRYRLRELVGKHDVSDAPREAAASALLTLHTVAMLVCARIAGEIGAISPVLPLCSTNGRPYDSTAVKRIGDRRIVIQLAALELALEEAFATDSPV